MIGNVLCTLLLMAIGYVLYQAGYQAGYKDGYDMGYDACFWSDREEPEIYMEHEHGCDKN